MFEPGFVYAGDNCADVVTGERCYPHDVVFSTGYQNTPALYRENGRTRVLKESTIVWLAEQAGYVVTKRDAGNFGDAENVDGQDVGVGDGEVEAGEVEVGGGKASGGRSGRKTKGE